MLAFKIYKFNTVDDAIQCMMKDTESNKYLHAFIPGEQGNCGICGDINTDHMEHNNNQDADATMLSESNVSEISHVVKGAAKSTIATSNINVKINIAKETLDAFEDPNICRICFDNILTPTNKITLECNHEFCTPCVLGYLKTNIIHGKVSLIL
jgi:hypothetical protein